MVTHANVMLWGQTVGLVIWDDRLHRAQFQYDRDFANGNLNVAPVMMPLSKAKGGDAVFTFGNLRDDTFKGLPGLLADSLPDRFGNQLLNAWLQSQNRDLGTENPVERLCYLGHRGMGALEFEPAHGELQASSEALQVDELVRVARNVVQQKEAFATSRKKGDQEALLDIIQVGTSAGGARAKAIVAFNSKTGEVRSGQIDGLKDFSYCLIKFDGVTNVVLGDPKGYGRIEYAYYLMARASGIEMMPCRLLEENGRAHFLTQRFDRVVDDEGKTHRLHMATLCGIAHMDFNDPLAHSYEQAFAVMRLLSLPYPAAVELFRRMCFNVIARNCDDHTKNTSFLMDPQGDWYLAPAYDMTFAYDPKNLWLHQHQMSLNGKRSDITRADLLTVAKEMSIKKADAIIDEVVAGVKTWRKCAKKAEMDPDQVEAIKGLHLLKL
ncbi:MAG: type II toxin-antitoxin system HipA family toxin [Flavobacteriales bacterium]|jgi:serine/threonine-protein kinase HipA|nr:type II toxin-antitoxin system HipA family toxin [Flavobacteriales bacterium]MBK7248526.1 type II toxin-antitoxin system HipA family toxin [Flavobacteriales bacterium]MBK9597813.1 type II toxin-antitoxin system HipA family toxin [Flavobacteriales bacterium]QQS73776.1 MAG: type II toxin-antitoxin system HipA family toxin [Flavobacteriales bacterium]HQV39063.1 type II toxin-antitoxin system HipA family toxin [Flavobacteriales bacterium]